MTSSRSRTMPKISRSCFLPSKRSRALTGERMTASSVKQARRPSRSRRSAAVRKALTWVSTSGIDAGSLFRVRAPHPRLGSATVVRELFPPETGLAFEAMRALRTDLPDENAFVRRVDEVQRPEGYRLAAAFDEGEERAAAVAGF